MKFSQRHAVSPIIATLLLIAIAVASGIIVYIFTGSLAGNLTKNGGNQVTEQISMDAYNYQTINSGVTLYLRNTGTASVTLNSFYLDGATVTVTGSCTSSPVAVQATCILTVTGAATSETAGSSHQVKAVSTDGGNFIFNVVAGQTG